MLRNSIVRAVLGNRVCDVSKMKLLQNFMRAMRSTRDFTARFAIYIYIYALLSYSLHLQFLCCKRYDKYVFEYIYSDFCDGDDLWVHLVSVLSNFYSTRCICWLILFTSIQILVVVTTRGYYSSLYHQIYSTRSTHKTHHQVIHPCNAVNI